MKGIPGRQYQSETIAFKRYNPLVALSNCLSCFIYGEQHERQVSRLTSRDVFERRDESLGPVEDWDITNAIRVARKDTSTEIDALANRLAILAAKLTNVPLYVPNFGQHLKRFLREEGLSWEVGLAGSGLATGMSWLSVPKTVPVVSSPFKIPSPVHPAAGEIARVFSEIDRGVYSTKLLNHAERVEEFDVKDRVTGQTIVTISRSRAPHALTILYSIQLTLLYLDMVWPLITRSLEVAAKISSFWADLLKIHGEWGSRKAQLPRNPFVTYVGSASDKVTAETLYGKRSLLLDVTGCGPNWQLDKLELPNIVAVAQAAAQFIKGRIIQRWGDWPGDGYIDPYSFIAMYESLFDMTDEVSRISQVLGWAKLEAGTHSLSNIQADFILTDGDWYSDNVGTAILGLKPVIGLNNAMATIDDRRTMPFWNVHDGVVGGAKTQGAGTDRTRYRLEYSVMTVHGRQTQTGDGSEVERYFIPGNAYMGGSTATRIRLMTSTEDPMAKLALEYYSSRSQSYITEQYTEPNVATDPTVYLTDWGTWAAKVGDSDGQDVFNRLISAMPENTVRSVEEVIMYRSEWFNHSFPVRMATDNITHHMSVRGYPLRDEEQDGHVEFTGEISLSSSDENIRSLIRLGEPISQAPVLPEVTPQPLPKS